MATGEVSDGEWEEEEQDVVVELSGMTNDDFISLSNNCKILGVDTEQPVLQIGGLFFTGEYQGQGDMVVRTKYSIIGPQTKDAIGTCVVFKEKELLALALGCQVSVGRADFRITHKRPDDALRDVMTQFDLEKKNKNGRLPSLSGAEQPGLRYFCHTRKKLVMNRTFLSEKESDNTSRRMLDLDSIGDFSAAGCSVGYHPRTDKTWKITHSASSHSSSGSGLEDDEVTNP